MTNLDSYPDWAVDQAFWLQKKIKEEGLRGIGYMEAAQKYQQKNAADTTQKWVNFSLRNKGFK